MLRFASQLAFQFIPTMFYGVEVRVVWSLIKFFLDKPRKPFLVLIFFYSISYTAEAEEGGKRDTKKVPDKY